jgi:exodeoxyribonuclease VII small subunit
MAKAPTVKPSSDLLTQALPEDLPETYEAAQRELEQLVAKLESGDLALEQLLVGYKRGAFLLEFCREKLTAVEQQIKVLDGSVLKPWAPK